MIASKTPVVVSRGPKEQKVAISYPHPSQIDARFHRSMIHLFQYDALGGRTADGKKVGGLRRITEGGAHLPVTSSAVIARARNRMVKTFLDLDGIDWFLMIDTDMVFQPDLVDRLVEAAHPEKRPIVGGLCFSYMVDRQDRKFWPTLFALIPGTERLRRLTKYPQNALIPVAATGAACLLIHRSVLVAMREKFPPPRPWFDETKFYDFDEEGKPIWESGDEISEDITFCLRAASLGFPVHVHTGIKLGHVKDFEVDEDMFLAEQAAIDLACVPALPTYVIIPSRNRAEMLQNLRAQLAPQATEVIVFDNGYETPPPGSRRAHQMTYHEMCNQGILYANKKAQGKPHNIVIMNDDVSVETALLAKLEAAMRLDDNNLIAYPDDRGILAPTGQDYGRTQSDGMGGQTMTGWCFMMRGEAKLRFDERYRWWYGDTDLEKQVREAGKHVVVVNAGAQHLDPMHSTFDNPERLADAIADEFAFAEKWGLNPGDLWLHQNGFVKGDE